MNTNFKNYSNKSNKLYQSKKNSFINNKSNLSKRYIFENNNNKSTKNANFINILTNSSLGNSKRPIKFSKKAINELFKRRKLSPNLDETKIKTKYNKTSTNSPIKKIIFNKYRSLKKLSTNNEYVNLSLNNNIDNNYNSILNKNIIKHSFSNHTNITNNNITTNFTNSVNNTIGSTTNNNSNNLSYKKKIKNKFHKKENKIAINILYKEQLYNIELGQYNDGLWLAKKTNEYFKLNLNGQQIHKLAEMLTNQINNIINYIIKNSSNIKDYGAVIDINKIIEQNKYNNYNKRYKIVVRYNKENYYFFINNDEDINDMADIIINNIIKKEKYDISALKEEIIKKIKNSFDKDIINYI